MPISTQWGPEGYFYPIQIAQYGLSHYSKYLAEPSRVKDVIEDGESGDTARWVINTHDATVDNVYEAQKSTRVIEFMSAGKTLQHSDSPILRLPLMSCQQQFSSKYYWSS